MLFKESIQKCFMRISDGLTVYKACYLVAHRKTLWTLISPFLFSISLFSFLISFSFFCYYFLSSTLPLPLFLSLLFNLISIHFLSHLFSQLNLQYHFISSILLHLFSSTQSLSVFLPPIPSYPVFSSPSSS